MAIPGMDELVRQQHWTGLSMRVARLCHEAGEDEQKVTNIVEECLPYMARTEYSVIKHKLMRILNRVLAAQTSWVTITRARQLKRLAELNEQEGFLSEARDLLKGVSVSKLQVFPKEEKIEFVLYQMELSDDPMWAEVQSRCIAMSDLEESTALLKRKYFECMIKCYAVIEKQNVNQWEINSLKMLNSINKLAELTEEDKDGEESTPVEIEEAKGEAGCEKIEHSRAIPGMDELVRQQHWTGLSMRVARLCHEAGEDEQKVTNIVEECLPYMARTEYFVIKHKLMRILNRVLAAQTSWVTITRARQLKRLAELNEQEGFLSEARDLLKGVSVSKLQVFPKEEKIEFVLYQMELSDDPMWAEVQSRCIAMSDLDESTSLLKIKYHKLLIKCYGRIGKQIETQREISYRKMINLTNKMAGLKEDKHEEPKGEELENVAEKEEPKGEESENVAEKEEAEYNAMKASGEELPVGEKNKHG